MKAMQAQEYGAPETLRLREVPRPTPGEGQVLVRVRAAAVNPADWKHLAGMFRQWHPAAFPLTPGQEGSGVVETVGPGVTHLRGGQEVFGAMIGSYAQYALASADDLQLKPQNLSFEEAATLTVGGLTAWGAVIDTAQVQAGQRVLVHGAAGGVGLYAVQLACWKGAHVTGTASAANLDLVRALGAEEALDYAAGPFEKTLSGLDAVIDTVGGDLPAQSVKVVRRGGIVVSVAGGIPEGLGDEQGVRALSAGRAKASNLAQLKELVEEGKLRTIVGKEFPLQEAGQALALVQTGHGRGRTVLLID